MCGRYSAAFSVEELRNLFELLPTEVDYAPRYNIAPTQTALSIVRGQDSPVLKAMRFGFAAGGKLIINARAETVTSRPTFRALIHSQRCLIPADGFYEWRENRGKKIPFRFTLPDNQPFAFAGLWSETDKGLGFVIITTAATIKVSPFHDRMPAILTKPDEFSLWLCGGTPPLGLLQPYSRELKVFEVDSCVNSPHNDRAECIAPLNKLW